MRQSEIECLRQDIADRKKGLWKYDQLKKWFHDIGLEAEKPIFIAPTSDDPVIAQLHREITELKMMKEHQESMLKTVERELGMSAEETLGQWNPAPIQPPALWDVPRTSRKADMHFFVEGGDDDYYTTAMDFRTQEQIDIAEAIRRSQEECQPPHVEYNSNNIPIDALLDSAQDDGVDIETLRQIANDIAEQKLQEMLTRNREEPKPCVKPATLVDTVPQKDPYVENWLMEGASGEALHILRHAPQAVYDEIARRVMVDRRIIDARMVVQVWVEHVCRDNRAEPDEELWKLIRRYNP